MYFQITKNRFKKIILWLVVFCFSINTLSFGLTNSYAQNSLGLPPVGKMVLSTPVFTPAIINGLTINPEKPFEFKFIVDTGNTNFSDSEFEQESKKLIKYFLAALTVPENEMWVNLSPAEKDRIISASFGQTEMGRDLLAEDYILKQLTASLVYPEDDLGEKFWSRVYKETFDTYGIATIPSDTFSRVWIVPDEALIYENGNSAFVVKSKLKVLMAEEADHRSQVTSPQEEHQINEIIKDIVVPEIEREVNEGKNFATLRQIYNAVILAKWYKEHLKNSFLTNSYIDQNKIKGINIDDKEVNRKIYAQYLESLKKGVYSYIREDYDEKSQKVIPRKYFSGGVKLSGAQSSLGPDDLRRGEIREGVLRAIDNPVGENREVTFVVKGINHNSETITFSRDEAMMGNRFTNRDWASHYKEFSESDIEQYVLPDSVIVRRGAQELVGKVITKKGKDLKWLDLATGTGLIVEEALAQGVKDIVGLDVAPKMLEAAKGRLDKKYPGNQVELREGNLLDLPGSFNNSEKYDVITIANASVFFDNETLTRVLRDVQALLNDDGIMLILYLRSHENEFRKPEELLSVLEDTGLKDVQNEVVERDFVDGEWKEGASKEDKLRLSETFGFGLGEDDAIIIEEAIIAWGEKDSSGAEKISKVIADTNELPKEQDSSLLAAHIQRVSSITGIQPADIGRAIIENVLKPKRNELVRLLIPVGNYLNKKGEEVADFVLANLIEATLEVDRSNLIAFLFKDISPTFMSGILEEFIDFSLSSIASGEDVASSLSESFGLDDITTVRLKKLNLFKMSKEEIQDFGDAMEELLEMTDIQNTGEKIMNEISGTILKVIDIVKTFEDKPFTVEDILSYSKKVDFINQKVKVVLSAEMVLTVMEFLEKIGKASKIQGEVETWVYINELPGKPKDSAMLVKNEQQERVAQVEKYVKARSPAKEVADIEYTLEIAGNSDKEDDWFKLVAQALKEGKAVKIDLRVFDNQDEFLKLLNISNFFHRFSQNIGQAFSGKYNFPFMELLKNAFVHGSKLDVALPIYIFFSLNSRGEILAMHFVDMAKEGDLTRATRYLINGGAIHLGGDRLGIALLTQQDNYLYSRKKVNNSGGKQIATRASLSFDPAMLGGTTRGKFRASKETMEYLGIGLEELKAMFNKPDEPVTSVNKAQDDYVSFSRRTGRNRKDNVNLGKYSLTLSAEKYLEKLIARPQRKPQAILASHEAIAEILEADVKDAKVVLKFREALTRVEKLAENMFYTPPFYKRPRWTGRSYSSFWVKHLYYPFRPEQEDLYEKMYGNFRFEEESEGSKLLDRMFQEGREDKKPFQQAQADEFIYFDLKEIEGAITDLLGAIKDLKSSRFTRLKKKLEAILADKDLFKKPEEGKTLTDRQRNLPVDLFYNYLGEVSFYVTASMHHKKNGWTRPQMLDEAGTIELEQVYHPPSISKDEEPVLNDISIDKNKSFFALTGPNAAGKSTTARAIGYSVVMAHLGLFVPAKSARISWMRNVNSIYPKEEAVNSGFSHFTNIVDKITKWLNDASDRDLFLLDEPVSGSDYSDLLGISTIFYEDLIKKHATVITATHIKEAIRLLKDNPNASISDKVQAWINSYEISSDGKLISHYKLVPGIAAESHALAALKKVISEESIVKLAELYYDYLVKGVPIEQEKLDEVISSIKHWRQQDNRHSYYSLPWEELEILFPEANFAFLSYDQYRRRLMQMHGITGSLYKYSISEKVREIEYREGEYEHFIFAGGLREGYNRVFYSYPGYDSRSFTNRFTRVERFAKTGKEELLRMNTLLKELVDIYFKHKKMKRRNNYDISVYKGMVDRIDQILTQVDAFIDSNNLRDIFDGRMIRPSREGIKTLDEIKKEDDGFNQSRDIDNLMKYLSQDLIGLDFLVGLAIGAIDNNLVAPEIADKPGILKIKGGKYILTKVPEGEEIVPQDFELNSPINIFIGPNASGKTNAFRMIQSLIKMAEAGFMVPAKEIEVSKGFDVKTFFGASDYDVDSFSYFENVLWTIYLKIIQTSGEDSLVILDEISGTDHLEMTAIQMAILTYLKAIGAKVILNTHLTKGIKELKDIVGADIYKMDYEFDEETRKFDFKRSVSLDPDVSTKSYGLEVATHYGLTEEQYQRAKTIAKKFTDSAMLVKEEDSQTQNTSVMAKDLGGIDLNPNSINMQVEKNGSKDILPNENSIPARLNIQIEGLIPVIINIQPARNLHLLLGLDDNDKSFELSEVKDTYTSIRSN